MSVVLVNRFFFPDESATSQLLTDLAFELSKKGCKVTAIASRTTDQAGKLLQKRGKEQGVAIHRVSNVFGNNALGKSRLVQYLGFYPGACFQLLSLVKRGDVVLCKTDPPLISVAAWIVCRLKRAALINWVQDLYPEVAIALGTPLLRSPLGWMLKRLRNVALRRSAANVAIGTRMAERLVDLGVKPERIAVIPNWADELAVQPIDAARSPLRLEIGLSPKDFVVGYSGNLGRAHEVETIVGAAKILADQSNIKFLFIGAGRQHERLRQLIERDRLENIVFAPHQPRERLMDSLGAADVHWVSLRPELEGLIVPSKLYGILAAGRPVLFVGDEDGELSRVVRDRNCGISVEVGNSAGLADAILRLERDPALCQQLGHAARKASDEVYPKQLALKQWTEVVAKASFS